MSSRQHESNVHFKILKRKILCKYFLNYLAGKTDRFSANAFAIYGQEYDSVDHYDVTIGRSYNCEYRGTLYRAALIVYPYKSSESTWKLLLKTYQEPSVIGAMEQLRKWLESEVDEILGECG